MQTAILLKGIIMCTNYITQYDLESKRINDGPRSFEELCPGPPGQRKGNQDIIYNIFY